MSLVLNRSKARLARFHPAALFALLMLLTLDAFAASVTLAWDPVTTAPVSGYRLYYGVSAGNYTTKIDAGNVTTQSVANLTEGSTYHFAVTAYDSSGAESGYSNDVTATVPSAAPVANFTASATSGVAPLAMNFTNTSTGSITSYSWNFGDGTTSTTQSPSHVYSAAGSYTVALTVTGSGGSNTKSLPNYINVTASPTASDTSAPTAPASLTASVASSTSVKLAWTASTDNVGVTGYRIERCQGTGCTAFAQIATASTTSYTDSSLAAATSYSYRVRATDAAGNVSAYSNVATATTTSTATTSGALTGNIVASTASANLTSTGTSDWARWPSYVHSASGGGQISNVAAVGGASIKSYSNDARSVSWSNGTPTASGTSTAGISSSGSGKGVQFTVPADTTSRTLTIYVGAQNATGTLTAHLSDGSAPDYTTTLSGSKSRKDGVVTLNYQAAAAGQTLTVTWNQTSGGGKGNVSLQGVALAGGSSTATPTPTPTPTGPTCPCSIWSATSVPTVAADSDTQAVELGVKFKSDVAGYITGIKFYKSNLNTGTHVGSLWSANGALLAQGTFANETASGWQTVTFATPVAIAANTVYVASYHTNVGYYAGDNGYFATTGVDNGPLHALQDGVSGGNGVYVYGGTPAFPSSTWNASNYWVDVTFKTN
jgi:PKD repeat protein